MILEGSQISVCFMPKLKETETVVAYFAMLLVRIILSKNIPVAALNALIKFKWRRIPMVSLTIFVIIDYIRNLKRNV